MQDAAATDALEVEWQFVAPDLGAVEAWLRGQSPRAPLTFEPRSPVTQTDAYLDTEDWAVYRAGFGLRLRRKPNGAEATLKAFADRDGGPLSRREITQPLPPEATELLATDGPVSQRVRLLARGRPLRSLFEIETQRQPFLVQQHGATLAELVLDEARVNTPPAPAPLLRVEIELTGSNAGGVEALTPLVAALTVACNLTPAGESKFGAGLAAAGLTPATTPDLGATLRSSGQPAGEYALATLRRHAADFLANEAGALLGEDIGAVHDMRVAARRLRVLIKAFAPVLPVGFSHLRDELDWAAEALGAVRDWDVQIESLRQRQGQASWAQATALGGLLPLLETARTAAREGLTVVLGSERYDELVRELTTSLQGESAPAEAASQPVEAFAAPMLRQGYRRLRKQARRITPASPATAYHELRKRARGLRYCVESVAELYGRPAKRLTEAAVALQDCLGEHQDSAQAIDRLQALALAPDASLPAATLVYAGELIGENRARMQSLRAEALPAFEDVQKRWRSLRRRLRRDEALPPEAASDAAVAATSGVTAARGGFWRRWFSRSV